MGVPNQRFVQVNITPTAGKNEPYFIILKSVLKEAWQKLDTYASFTLYTYFASNRNNYLMEFSPEAVKNETGLSVDSVRRAFRKLQDEGFIVPSGKNKFTFYDKSQKSNIKIKPIIEKRKSFFDDETGENFRFTYKELLETVGDKETADTLWKEAEED